MIDNTKTLIEHLLSEFVKPSMTAVDMTVGNGYDMIQLLNHITTGFVYGFDIQQEAIQKTSEKLSHYTNYRLFLENHKNILNHIKVCDVAIYNLGFLPGGDKRITTKAKDVLESLKALLSIHTTYIIFTLYPGHPSGKEEIEVLEEFLKGLSQKEYIVMKYQFINQINHPPYVLTIRRKR